MAEAFARAKQMFAAIAAAMALTTGDDRQASMALIGPYKSRGKGGKHHKMALGCMSRALKDRSKYRPRACFAAGKR